MPQDPLTTKLSRPVRHFIARNLRPVTGNPLAEGMESCSYALDPLATQSHHRFLSGSKVKRYTSQLSFKIPRPAPKTLYTMVPEGVDGAGQPVTSKLAVGCLQLSWNWGR